MTWGPMRSVLLALALSATCAGAAEPPPFVLEATIPLESTSGRIDHMAVDLRRQRLYVAELGNGTVDAIDLTARKVVGRIDGLKEPQGVGYAAKADLIVVASAGDGSVRFYRGEDWAAAGVLPLGDDADNVRVDDRSGTVVVGYGTGGLAIIDPMTRSKVADIHLPAHSEGFQLDPARDRAFVNVPDAREVAVIDLSGARALASWRVPGALGNFPMAYDAIGMEVAIVTRSPPELIVLDAAQGQVKVRKLACGDSDDVFLDRRRRRIYISCGSGEVDAWQQTGTDYRPLPPTRTGGGARTSLFVPELDRLFVAERAGLIGSRAAILVLRPQEGAPHERPNGGH